NEYVQPERAYRGNSALRLSGRGNRPGDDYNARADWYELLTSHGWKYVFRQGEVAYWRRPGKAEPGISATTNYAGSNLLYVFSTNAAPLEDRTAYSLFSAFAFLEHNGDFHEAAKRLAEIGFGKPAKSHLSLWFEPISKPEDT